MRSDSIEDKLKESYILATKKWCEDNFGVSTRKRRDLVVFISKRARKIKKYEVYGVYCFFRNKITIYLPNCRTKYDLVSTMIHEYTHYLQSRGMYKYYEDEYYYSTNPYERQARRNEVKYTKTCIRDIKKLI